MMDLVAYETIFSIFGACEIIRNIHNIHICICPLLEKHRPITLKLPHIGDYGDQPILWHPFLDR
jgi:hypothetical protein